MTKISSLTALTGAGTDTAADLVPVVDMSETGAARNKKQTYAEFLLALKEGVQDIVGTMAIEGTNVTLNYDDGAGTLEINATSPVPGDISGLNEAIDDRVAALITAGSGISKSYNDGAGTLTLTATVPAGGLIIKGSTDCSANPNYPVAVIGEAYVVSVAGKIGGASGTVVEVGDVYFATADNAGGTQASVGSSWAVLQGNILAGGYAPGGTDVALGDGGTGASLTDPNADRILFWDDSAGAMTWLTVGTGLAITTTTLSASATAPTESIILAPSDETTAITTGTAKMTFRMPYAFTLTEVRASVTTAPTGSTILIDINESGSTILSTKLMIDASEKTSKTAATAAVISDSSLADDAEITIDFDQVGSTIAGAGVKVYLIGHQ